MAKLAEGKSKSLDCLLSSQRHISAGAPLAARVVAQCLIRVIDDTDSRDSRGLCMLFYHCIMRCT